MRIFCALKKEHYFTCVITNTHINAAKIFSMGTEVDTGLLFGRDADAARFPIPIHSATKPNNTIMGGGSLTQK